MWSNEPPTPSAEFLGQVVKTNIAINHLQKEISRLDAVFKASGNEQISKQVEFLKGYATSYKGIKHVLKLKEVAMSQKWDDLDAFPVSDAQQERVELSDSYAKMVKLMNIYEQNTYKIIAAPPGWFSTSIAEWETWVLNNPWKTAGGVACGAGVFAGLGALLGLGAMSHLICQAAAVAHLAQHALVGGLLGLGLGVVVVLILAGLWGAYTSCKRRKPQKEKTDIEKIAEMVEALKKIPEDEFAKQMDSIITECSAMAIPSSEDWMCLVCHAQGDEVKEPVKAHGCKRNHVLCKACWEKYTKTPAGCGGKCMLCFQ